MKLSVKSQYALEALVDLQVNAGGGPDTIGSIAGRRAIPARYLVLILAKLKKAGVVQSVRGAKGGYRLSKSPDDVTAGEVIRALDGPLCPVQCVPEGGKSCPMQGSCITRPLWIEVSRGIGRVADAVTLADLARACENPHAESILDYSI